MIRLLRRYTISQKTVIKDDKRWSWSSRKQYLMQLIGATVGLGNSWRFPIVLVSGGGVAFLIPYTIVIVLLSIPITYMELSLGQFSEKGPFGVWILSPITNGVGFVILWFSCCTIIYYNMLISYCAFFFVASFQPSLPWGSCDHSWAEDNCYVRENNKTIFGLCVKNRSLEYCQNLQWQTSSEHFWLKRVLQRPALGIGTGSLGPIKWELAVALLFCCVIVFVVLARGIKNMERIATFTTCYPYACVVLLLFITLIDEGSGRGVKVLFSPNFEKLLEFQVWRSALEQVFYSMGLGSGVFVMMGSYCPFRSPVNMDAIMINLVDFGTSLIYGIVIFNCLGAISYDLQIPVEDLIKSGKTLAFVLIPESLTYLRGPNHIWAMIFYSMLFCVGITTEYALMASNLTIIYDRFPHMMQHKIFVSGCASLALFLFGLPLSTENGSIVLSLVDTFCGGPLIITVALIEVLVVFWMYGVHKFVDDVHFMLGFRPTNFEQGCWLLSPLILMTAITMIMTRFTDLEELPDFLIVFCWTLYLTPVMIVLGLTIYNLVIYYRSGVRRPQFHF